MGLGIGRTSLEDLIERAGGCAVIDGGFATQLEAHGAAIDDPLWSALCLITNPDLIKRVHLEYLGRCRSISNFILSRIPHHNNNHALVAASIGSYGAYLADGSEYSGYYRSDVSLNMLKDFHRRRLQVLVEAGPDLLAFETIPNKLEAQVAFLELVFVSFSKFVIASLEH